jgi:hypothetical protein
MATIPRPNGDVLSGVNQNADVGALVSLTGINASAWAIVVKNISGVAQDIREEGQSSEIIESILLEILRSSTISFLQIENDTSGQISVMLEGNGGWTAESMQAAIRALGSSLGVNNIDVTGTVVTNNGLKLATS